MTIIGTGVSFSNDPLSLLDMIVKFCERTDLRVPDVVMTTTDSQIRQLRSLLEEVGKDLAKRGAWEGMTFEATHTSLAAADQGAIVDIATNNFHYIKDETIWNRTTRLPIYGPMSEREWQARQALVQTGPRYRYRIRGGKLLISPTPTAGDTYAFEYVTKNWVLAANGDGREYFLVDEDVTVMPSDLLLMGLRWRWKAEKGREYAEDFRLYEMQVADALGRDATKPVLDMAGGSREAGPLIYIPAGSWVP
jgi:hypothetical protein